MKRTVGLCILFALAGCPFQQDGPRTADKSSADLDTLRSDLREGKALDGSDDSINRVAAVAVPEGGKPVVAKTDADGTIHLLYNSADGPKYVKSSDNGKTFEAPIPVVDEASWKHGLI